MEPFEFEARRGRGSRSTTGAPRPDNRSGPMAVQAPGAANPSAEPYGYGGGYSDDGGYGYSSDGYGSDGGTGPYGTSAYNTGSYNTGSYNTNTGSHNTGASAGGRRPEAIAADAPSPGWEQAYGRGAPGRERAHSTWDGPAQRGYPAPRGATGPRNGDSLSVAARILSGADYEAAAITQQAAYQAAMIRQQVAHEAKEIREAAGREAERIRQQAAMQASAVREAAEIEAAEVHTAVMSMQTELSEFAARISNTLPNPVLPRTPPTGRSAVGPAASPSAPPRTPPTGRSAMGPAASPSAPPWAQPQTVPAERPTGKPGPQPAGKPGARSVKKPASGQGRQVVAFRFVAIAASALFLFAAAAGAVEIHLHGFDFFVFRSTGTGETGPTGLQEDQGPGQPDAPKPTPSHIKVQPSPHSKAAVHKGHSK
jgi:hypothetical protein